MADAMLQRGTEYQISGPNISQVLKELRSLHTEHFVPEFQLHYGEPEVGQPQLWVMALFTEHDVPLEWCVEFVLSKAQSSELLARKLPTEDVFLERTLCGCVTEIQRECIIDNESLVAEAAGWFLEYGTAKPELVWLNSERSMRSI